MCACVCLQELLRKLTIEMVLATDMKQHFAISGLFQSKVHLLAALSAQQRSSAAATAGNSSCSGSLPSLLTVASGLSASAAAASSGRVDSPSVSASPSRQQLQLATSLSISSSGGLMSTTLPPAGVRTGSLVGVPEGAAAGGAAGDRPGLGGHSSGSGGAPAHGPCLPPAASGNASGSFVLTRLRSSNSMLRRCGGAGGSGPENQAGWEEDTETRSLYLQVGQCGGAVCGLRF